MTKLKAPRNAAPVHWRGKVYEVRSDGSVQVPDAAAAALRAHGFTPWPGAASPPADRAKE